MEKYSRWRDPGTQIQPFLPPKPALTNESAAKAALNAIKNYVLGPPIALLKLFISGALFLALGLLDSIAVVLWFSGLDRQYRLLIYPVFLRPILFLWGFYWIKSSTVTLQKGTRKQKRAYNNAVQDGDLLVCNSLSYVDIMYLALRHAPIFVQVFGDGSVKPVGFWGAVYSAGSYPTSATLNNGSSDTTTLSQLATNAKLKGIGPIVVFPEGTTSNGRGLLKFLPVFKGVDLDKQRIHTFGIKYEYESFCPSYTVGSPLVHVFWLCAQVANFMEVRYLPPEELRASLVANTLPAGQDAVSNHLAGVLGQVLRVRRIALGLQDKKEFLDYYKERESGAKRRAR
ncbi:hypothetical protein BJ742DRAFT_811991 [Cladochytrium replicatum]|nr:hypothetical protein BJ742DRAFT_811991 [Cladochytrium replicatum]